MRGHLADRAASSAVARIETIRWVARSAASGPGAAPDQRLRQPCLTDPHAPHSLSERVTVDAVAIPEEVSRRGVVRAGVNDLLGRPGCGGALGHVEGEDPPARVGEDDEDEEHAQAGGGDREEVGWRPGSGRGWRGRSARSGTPGVCRKLGLELRAARSRLFQDGMGLGPAKARPRPTPRHREHGSARG